MVDGDAEAARQQLAALLAKLALAIRGREACDRVVSPRTGARKAMVHRYYSALNFRNADAAACAPVTGTESVSKRAYGHGVVGERSGLCGVASHGGNRTYTHICQLVRTFGNSVWGCFRRSGEAHAA